MTILFFVVSLFLHDSSLLLSCLKQHLFSLLFVCVKKEQNTFWWPSKLTFSSGGVTSLNTPIVFLPFFSRMIRRNYGPVKPTWNQYETFLDLFFVLKVGRLFKNMNFGFVSTLSLKEHIIGSTMIDIFHFCKAQI